MCLHNPRHRLSPAKCRSTLSKQQLVTSHVNFGRGCLQVDRLYDWKTQPNAPIRTSFEKQAQHTMREFKERLDQAKVNLAEQVRRQSIAKRRG
jgi:hypothetical protein